MKDITKMTNREILNYLRTERSLKIQVENTKEDIENNEEDKFEFIQESDNSRYCAYDNFR